MSHAIYKRAVKALLETYGTPDDRDWIKVVQLFDRLLTKGHSIHVNDLRQLCKDAGYDGFTSDDIGRHYDILRLIRKELENSSTIDYWQPERIDQIINGQ